ncbi:hypothetical protein NITHO_240004 [Nitrolancea hollandica Lb]|uniref:Uncharacterized protein n=1 Tax=Nitrolancea hollandica Lb TaxID=1129897 RepID=I4EFS6_9BACT|nr:hypothetical protein NITHO_240004 [Nitrolancea hollandica Lb]
MLTKMFAWFSQCSAASATLRIGDEVKAGRDSVSVCPATRLEHRESREGGGLENRRLWESSRVFFKSRGDGFPVDG